MARRQCLIEQYDAYRDPETLNTLNGERLVSENIADLTGIKLAYGAYRRWSREFNGTRHKLIGVEFTPDQLFWIVAAQNWCSVSREGKKSH
jgi:membrane metallo-endopeptidase-like protein 1